MLKLTPALAGNCFAVSSGDLDSIFNSASKMGVGLYKPSNYPPHNILEDRIEVAVAGFNKDELTVQSEDGNVTISGKQKEKNVREYIHKGISEKSFSLTVKLSKYYVVSGTSLQNGILTVELTKIVPEEMKPKIYEIV